MSVISQHARVAFHQHKDTCAVMNTMNIDLSDSADTISIPEPVLYKTDRAYNINVLKLAQHARDDISRVRLIAVPAPVKNHRVGGQEFNAPILSEVGGGSRNNFCQVIAGKDGRPVCVDDIHYINTDPTRSNINHGTASVGIGNFFSVGWCNPADTVLLAYEIIRTEELVINNAASNDDERSKPIAKLTCKLVAYDISDWKTTYSQIPEMLTGLMAATRDRLRNEADVPFYLDIFRMIKSVDDLKWVAEQAIEEDVSEIREKEDVFMTKVMREIADIRFCQYAALPANATKRKVEQLKLIETLRLDPDEGFVDISLTPVRADTTVTTFRLRLTHENFEDPETGRMLLERGLVLGATSFDRLKLDLEHRRDKTVIVTLSSLR